MKAVLFMHCAICWKCLKSTISTSYISRYKNRHNSNKEIGGTQSAGNQRQYSTSLVGTSETTRAAPYPKEFCQWLSGIIDGDGCFLVSKKGYTSLEVTMSAEDLPLLQFIKTKLGGSIKMRSNAKAYRYRIHNKESMLKLVACVNGYIRHSSRLHQLHRICTHLQVSCQSPKPLDKDSHWFAGFFDADGTIALYFKNERPQLSVRVTNKLLQDVQSYRDNFGGSIYFDRSQNGYYSWSIQSRETILEFLVYFKSHPFRSQKAKRFFLIHDYFRLYDRKAFSKTSPHFKEWALFLDKWNQKIISL